jgi:hypothetical protein
MSGALPLLLHHSVNEFIIAEYPAFCLGSHVAILAVVSSLSFLDESIIGFSG